jgi:hypothetical protein
VKHWIQTHTGRAFDLMYPTPEMVSLEDIAHALSHLCRYTGHSRRFYSVAEHSIECMHHAPAHIMREALMHDATEAYVGDMAAPLKALIPAYQAIEARVRHAIALRFDLAPVVPPTVRAIDLGLLQIERAQLLGEPPADWKIPPTDLAPRKLRLLNPSAAKREFLDLARIVL